MDHTAIRRIIETQGGRLGDRFKLEHSLIDEQVGPIVGYYRNPKSDHDTMAFGETGILIYAQSSSVVVRYVEIEDVETSQDKKHASEVFLLSQGSRISIPVIGYNPKNEKFRDVYILATLFLLIIRAL